MSGALAMWQRAMQKAFCYGMLICAITGCGRGNAEPDRDGTGAARVPQWHVAANPELDIGIADGDPRYTLYNVVGAKRLSDGVIAVANSGTHEIRLYDTSGTYLRSLGREGAGPGEFESLTWMGTIPGDSIMAWDHSLTRMSVFTRRGEFIRSLVPDPEPAGLFPQVYGAFSNGSFVVASGWDASALAQAGEGVRRDWITFFHYGRNGELLDTIVRSPGAETYLTKNGPGFSTNPVPFAHEAFVAVGGKRFFVGDNSRNHIRVLTPAGQPIGDIVTDYRPKRVTEHDVERYKHDRLEKIVVESYRATQEKVLSEVPFPKTTPFFGGIKVDSAADGIWVGDYLLVENTPREWTVFDSQGGKLATVQTPVGLEIFQIGADFLLGGFDDDAGTEHVRLYRLDRVQPR